MKPISDDRRDEDAVGLDLEQPLAEVARRGSPGRLRPGLALLQVRLGRTQTLLLLHLGGTLAKGVANCQTFIVISAPQTRAQNDEDRLSGRPSRRLGSGGGTRTHNDSVNSRAFCRLNYPRMVYWAPRSRTQIGWAQGRMVASPAFDLGVAVRAQ